MKLALKNKKSKLFISLISILTTTLILSFFYYRCGIYFEINDERYMIHILSGSMTGTPNPHVIYMNYILGLIFSGLYSITPHIPWLGIFFIGCYFLSFVCIMYNLIIKGNTLLKMAYYWILSTIFICINLYIFCELQFTTIAGVLAVTGYFLLLLDKKKNIGIFILFEILAIFIRDQSMMLVQPIGLAMLACVMLQDILKKHSNWKTSIKEYIKYPIILCGIFLVAFIGNYIIGDYGSNEWKNYAEYNDLNTDLFDYYGKPYDSEIISILEKHNVSSADYICFSNDFMCMSNLDNKCLTEIRDYAQTIYSKDRQNNLGPILKTTLQQCVGKTGVTKNITSYDISYICFLVFVSVLIILSRKYFYFLWLLVLELTKFVLMFYLVFRGRYPLRVTNILMFAEILFILFIIYKVDFHLKRSILRKLILLGCSTILLLKIASGGIFTYWSVRTVHLIKNEYTASINELFDYWHQDDSGYLIDTRIVEHYSGKVLDTKWHDRQSFLWCGGWYYNSPVTDRAEKEYLERYKDNLKTIIRVSDTSSNAYILDRLRECGMENELIDTLVLPNGEIYEIYQLIKAY